MVDFKKRLYSNLNTMTNNQYKKYLEEENSGYITIREHPEDSDIIILNYTTQTVVERRWNNETMTARGLILDITNVNNNDIKILSKPFPKFFNYGENPEYEKNIDFSNIESVMEKMDGSLGISYFIKGEIRFATRGSFESKQALKATEIWQEKYSKFENMFAYKEAPVTYLVEIIYPENRVVVDYSNKEELVMLGVNMLFGNVDCDYSTVKDEADRLRMPIAKQYNKLDIETMLDMKKSISANEEGWILRFSNGKRLKIKGDRYLDVHRAIYGLSDKAKVGAWAKGEISSLIALVPEEFRDEIEGMKESLDAVAEAIHNMMTLFYQQAIEQCKSRKDFAIHTNTIISQEYRKFMFDALKNGKVSIELVKEHIYRDYKHYLEVIK